ncbi:MAG: glycine betaine/proline transport system permease protein [Candidatus Petromonas sp.]|jgi:glycine betaine/proline transport system permease protein|nr:glycine betaine/proline transport system permease protein [Candidatus Petromonas sp.]
MSEFPEYLSFKFGIYVADIVNWLIDNFESFFNAVRDLILWFLLKVDFALHWIPWWIIIVGVFLLGWRIKKLPSGITYALMLFIVGLFGLWDQMISTLSLVLTSVVISLIIGIPIGILMAYSNRLESFMKPLLDGMQTMPSFVYLIPAVIFFSLGTVPAIFATTIYSVPPVIRLTNLAIRNVDKEMLEAAHSFGSSPWQILTKVEIPQAMPTIMTGVNQTTMMAMAMVVIASMVGAKGLGSEVLIAINRIDIARGFEAGLSIVFVAIIIDRITQGIADRFRIPE